MYGYFDQLFGGRGEKILTQITWRITIQNIYLIFASRASGAWQGNESVLYAFVILISLLLPLDV